MQTLPFLKPYHAFYKAPTGKF